MNSLLRLEFFKSLGFVTKESGMTFISGQPKLIKQIDEKVEELDEYKNQIIEDINDIISVDYADELKDFIINDKKERARKKSLAKEAQKEAQKSSLKDEMKAEILREIKTEEESKIKNKLKKKYKKIFPEIDSNAISKINDVDSLFFKVIQNVDEGEIDFEQLKTLENLKNDLEKSINTIVNVYNTLQKINSSQSNNKKTSEEDEDE